MAIRKNSRAHKLMEAGLKEYDQAGLIPALARMLDMATRNGKEYVKTDYKLEVTGRDFVEMLRTHCSEHFALAVVSGKQVEALEREMVAGAPTKEDILLLCQYYAERADFSWMSGKPGLFYIIKNFTTDLSRSKDWAHSSDDLGGKIR
jgi:hypothetical protein